MTVASDTMSAYRPPILLCRLHVIQVGRSFVSDDRVRPEWDDDGGAVWDAHVVSIQNQMDCRR
jgi:hypothetical protein